MESVLSIIASLMLAVSGATATGDDMASAQVPSSSELGLAELSPAGEAGGWAMPASGCSPAEQHSTIVHDCNDNPSLTVDDPIIRDGDTTTVYWDTNGIANCILLGDLVNQGPVSGTGSEVVTPATDTTYILVCGSDPDVGPLDTVTIRVLPRVQET